MLMGEKDQKSSNGAGQDEIKQDEKPSKPEADSDECAEVRDRLLRLAAEFDNYKKRVAKEIDGAKDMGRADVIVRLLPTLDEFELALDAFGKEDEHMKGVALIFSNFISALKSQGLKEIDAAGKFDPYKHEIVMGRKSDRPEGEILEVVRNGYMLNSIMLRPASVIISKGDDGKEGEQSE